MGRSMDFPKNSVGESGDLLPLTMIRFYDDHGESKKWFQGDKGLLKGPHKVQSEALLETIYLSPNIVSSVTNEDN